MCARCFLCFLSGNLCIQQSEGHTEWPKLSFQFEDDKSRVKHIEQITLTTMKSQRCLLCSLVFQWGISINHRKLSASVNGLVNRDWSVPSVLIKCSSCCPFMHFAISSRQFTSTHSVSFVWVSLLEISIKSTRLLLVHCEHYHFTDLQWRHIKINYQNGLGVSLNITPLFTLISRLICFLNFHQVIFSVVNKVAVGKFKYGGEWCWESDTH